MSANWKPWVQNIRRTPYWWDVVKFHPFQPVMKVDPATFSV